VPFEGSGLLTHRALPQSGLVVLEGAPHGCNVSHAREFNQALIGFLSR
jgi:pimeloyl-ACP methyl ester carboxylesterase